MAMTASLRISICLAVGFLASFQPEALAQRKMESLSRGTIAIPQGGGKVYVGWRLLLGTDPDGVAFHLERSTDGASPVRSDQGADPRFDELLRRRGRADGSVVTPTS